MNRSQFSKTPTLAVFDNRGLTVRDIAYCRHPDTPGVTDERITRHRYDVHGFLKQSVDPRLHAAGLVNFSYQADLTGHVLRAQGADNGTTLALNDAAGRPFITVSNIGATEAGSDDRSLAVIHRRYYEEAGLPGRPLSITEQLYAEEARVSERFIYGENTLANQDLNLCGQCVSHYDTAGLVQTDAIALTGAPQSISRRLLKDADNPETLVDWHGENPCDWDHSLASEAYRTHTLADSTGADLRSTDAAGHHHRVAYSLAGFIRGSWLTLKGRPEQVIVKCLELSAAGQKLREEHGNGLVTIYTYEPTTQRLNGINVQRPAGHDAGAKVLQDLRYGYDPVGNVLTVRNDAEETRFWRNQKVVPENTYRYDSLYQLVAATGREMANAGRQCDDLPPLSDFDSATYTNYTRTYDYDRALNLTRIWHFSTATDNNYTSEITLSTCNNRGVLSTLTEDPAHLSGLFTASGQQKMLGPGQHLGWTLNGELLKATLLVRTGAPDDNESYRYDAGSQRIVKVSTQHTGNTILKQRVVYLPRLELRIKQTGAATTEFLQAVCMGVSGSAQVQVLYWADGKPEGINSGQVRYSYATLTGSSNLEVDGDGNLMSREEYYPNGGTALLIARNHIEVGYKTLRYCGKERDATGLYYFGFRYHQPWAGRWLSADPAGTVDGSNLFRFCRNNPSSYTDYDGLLGEEPAFTSLLAMTRKTWDRTTLTDSEIKSEYHGMSLSQGAMEAMSDDEAIAQINGLDGLAKAAARKLIIYPQYKKRLTPMQLLNGSGLQSNPGYYRIIATGADRSMLAKSRLNISVKKEYVTHLTEAVANLAIRHPSTIAETKVTAYDKFGKVSESAIIYLNSQSLDRAKAITQKFLAEFNKSLKNTSAALDAFLDHPAVGMFELAKGVYYKEIPTNGLESIALETVQIVQQARKLGKGAQSLSPEKALKKALAQRGYCRTNPALVGHVSPARQWLNSKRF